MSNSFLRTALSLINSNKVVDHKRNADDQAFFNAVNAIDSKKPIVEQTQPSPTDDKGLFGSRQIEFVQDVYHIPQKPAGDYTQPVGLLTQRDLTNYVAYRKGDRLTFRYASGDAGNNHYTARKNGQSDFTKEFDWSDGLIQELIDEGACKLI